MTKMNMRVASLNALLWILSMELFFKMTSEICGAVKASGCTSFISECLISIALSAVEKTALGILGITTLWKDNWRKLRNIKEFALVALEIPTCVNGPCFPVNPWFSNENASSAKLSDLISLNFPLKKRLKAFFWMRTVDIFDISASMKL